jgi:hypothetical protein
MIEVPMEKRTYRIGQIAPGSNTTMEREIAELLRAREDIAVQIAENRLGVPVASTAIWMARGLHDGLELDPIVPKAGGFLGRHGLELSCAGCGRLSPRRSRR